MYSTNEFLANVYSNTVNTAEKLGDCPLERLKTLIEEKRSRLREILALDELEGMQHDVKIAYDSCIKREFYRIDKYNMTVLPGLCGPLYGVVPETPNGLAVVYCHGHGRGVDDTLNIGSVIDPYHKTLPLYLAKMGYTVLTMEYMGFGHMKFDGENCPSDNQCTTNHLLLSLGGLSLLGVRVYQTQKVIDFAKNILNFKRLAICGVSGGGMVTTMTSALSDDADITGAGILCYTNTFKKSIMDMPHCICNFIPGMLTVGEEPDIIALSAPRPLLLSAGRDDEIFPIKAAEDAAKYVSEVYGRLGISDKVTLEVFDGEHEISEKYLANWLEKLF